MEGIDASGVSVEIPAPVLADGDREELEAFSSELYEWLALIRLDSPRIQATDNIDPYIARYQAPENASGHESLCRVSWQGFMNAEWLRKLLVILLTACSNQGWFSLSGTEFATGVTNTGNELMLLFPSRRPGHYLMWESPKTE